jgi:hypothetical protein
MHLPFTVENAHFRLRHIANSAKIRSAQNFDAIHSITSFIFKWNPKERFSGLQIIALANKSGIYVHRRLIGLFFSGCYRN